MLALPLYLQPQPKGEFDTQIPYALRDANGRTLAGGLGGMEGSEVLTRCAAFEPLLHAVRAIADSHRNGKAAMSPDAVQAVCANALRSVGEL